MIVRTTSSTGQYIRVRPGLAEKPVGTAQPGEIVDVLRVENDEWVEVSLRQVEGFMLRSLLEEITEAVAPVGHALVGIDAPAPKWAYLDGINYGLIRTARVEAVKLYCADDIDGEIVGHLRSDGAQFIMTRLYAPLTSKQSGSEVMSELIAAALRLYEAGVRYFEVANEPNLYDGAGGSHEGLGICWENGREFATWWLDAAAYLRERMPEAKLGFPACSPGWAVPNFRYDPERFMVEAAEAVQAADWIAQHVYWQGDQVEQAIVEAESFARKYPHKTVIITEFSNPAPYISAEWRAAQYVDFYARAKRLPLNVGALICFTLTNPGFIVEQWRENGIAEVVGGRS